MARSHGRVYASIWDDEDFCALSRGARQMYFFLFTQRDIEHSGVIGLRVSRWADTCDDETTETIRAWIEELAEARFVVVDWLKEELLVRSLIRRDEVWKQPNVFKAAAGSIRNVRSPHIRAALLAELERLDLAQANKEVATLRDTLAEELRLSLPDHTRNPSGTLTGTLPRTLAEPQAVGSEAATGEGEKGNGSNHRVSTFPIPPSPSPRGPAGAKAGEEGDRASDQPPDQLAALIAEVRDIRPEWSSSSIRRALNHPDVRERGWPLASTAIIEVARDSKSQAPGRLAHDGPWWTPLGTTRAAGPPRPPWCGTCDEDTRLTCDEHPRRCPACHPLNCEKAS